MSACLCGNPVGGEGAECPRCAALRVLGLNPDATERQVKVAYRVLVKVWHPDRFEGDQGLREAAEAKLKEINSAFALLSSTFSSGGTWQRTRRATTPASAGATAQNQPAAERPRTSGPLRDSTPTRSSSRWIFPAVRVFFRVFLVAAAVLLGRYLWIAFDVQGFAGQGAANVYGYGKQSLLNELAAPKRRFVDAVEQDLRRLNLLHSAPAAVEMPQTAETAPPGKGKAGHGTAAARQPGKGQNAAHTIYPYITVGSTRDEVLEELGTPTASTESKLVYGRSELDFRDNRVDGWKIDPVASPIRVKLWPGSAVDPSLDSFTVGDTKDVVLVVQGTPTAFTADKFEYGGSAVYFRDNLVVRWKSDPASIPLRARGE